jgi:hypothetical protein
MALYIQQWTEQMVTEQSIPEPAVATGRSRDLYAKLYRKIGISAVVAALEAAKPIRNRKDLPLVLRDDSGA